VSTIIRLFYLFLKINYSSGIAARLLSAATREGGCATHEAGSFCGFSFVVVG
jgi:hypothetical protein